MPVVTRLAAVLVILMAGLPVAANGLRARNTGTTTAAYSAYYPPTIVYVPVFPAALPVFVPPPCAPTTAGTAPPRIFATPTPAPPTTPATTPPPPAATSPAPGVSESRYPDASVATVRDSRSAVAPRCSVGFWNQSGRDVILRIDGQPRILSRGEGVTIDLPHRFVWQVDERTAQMENVPAQQTTVDLVIRR